MNDGNLYSLLQSASRLTLFVELLRASLGGFGLFIATVLLALTFDAVLSLQPWGLIVLDALLVLLMGALGIYAGLQAYRNLFYPRRAARLIERQLGIHDNRLINAVDLASEPAGAVSPELLRKSVDVGEAFAADLDVFDCINFSRLWKPAGVAGGVLLFTVVSYFLAPQAFGTVLPRLLDPTGDHPPFTLLQFAVKVAPEQIYHGRGANISVELSGPQIPSQADIVTVRNGEKQRSPMFRSGETSFALPIERADTSCEFYIDTPAGRSRRYPFNVLQVPLFEKVELAYDFPKYTAWPAHQHTLDARGIQALSGSKVTLKVKSNIPLRDGRLELLQLKTGEVLPLKTSVVGLSPSPTDVTTVSATFLLEFSGRFKLSLTATNSAESLEKIEGTLTAVDDRAPRVAIVEPAPHLIVVEDWKVPVVIQATDDIAISRLRLFRSVNGWGPTPVDLPFDAKQATIGVGHYEFDLKSLGARAGDVIQYFASAYDNRPPTGQSTDTDSYVIQVISEAEYTELARRDYQLNELEQEFDKFRRQLEALQKEREEFLRPLEELRKKLAAGEKLTAAEQEQLAQLEKQMQQYQAQAEQLATALRERAEQTPLYDLEQPYQDMLQKLSKQLDQQASNAKQAAEKLSKMRKDPGAEQTQMELKEAVEQFAKEDEPFDRDTQEQLEQSEEELKLIRKADDLLANAERLQAIALKQRDLADRLAQFRDRENLSGDDRQRAERLAKEQELLQQELEEVAQGLEQSAQAAQDDLPKMAGDALQLAAELKKLKIPADQSKVARQARQGAGEKAREASESAAKKLESLMAKLCDCKGAGGELAGKIDGPLKLPGSGMENSLKQLSQGRRLPGLPRPGQSEGQGQTGAGIAGSRARTVIVGPHTRSEGDSAADQARLMNSGGRGRGNGPGVDADGQVSPETLSPSASSDRAVSGQNMRGVPVGYRDQAEAYFKRLAEEK